MECFIPFDRAPVSLVIGTMEIADGLELWDLAGILGVFGIETLLFEWREKLGEGTSKLWLTLRDM